MKIPAEFEDILRGVELTERETLFLSWITSWDDYTIQNMRTVLGKVITGQILGITPDRLLELAQADREGRCVVLPAKPDQIIYQWRKGDDCLSVSRLDGVQVNADGEITYPIWNGYLIPEDFGKTVFLTREEAALRREQDG